MTAPVLGVTTIFETLGLPSVLRMFAAEEPVRRRHPPAKVGSPLALGRTRFQKLSIGKRQAAGVLCSLSQPGYCLHRRQRGTAALPSVGRVGLERPELLRPDRNIEQGLCLVRERCPQQARCGRERVLEHRVEPPTLGPAPKLVPVDRLNRRDLNDVSQR